MRNGGMTTGAWARLADRGPDAAAVQAAERDRAHLVAGGGGRVLLLSMRRLADLVGFCLNYEFEDVVAEVTGADRVDAGDRSALEFSRRAYKFTRFATGSRRLAGAWAPPPSTVRLQRGYEPFFPRFNHPHEAFALAPVPHLGPRRRVAACVI